MGSMLPLTAGQLARILVEPFRKDAGSIPLPAHHRKAVPLGQVFECWFRGPIACSMWVSDGRAVLASAEMGGMESRFPPRAEPPTQSMGVTGEFRGGVEKQRGIDSAFKALPLSSSTALNLMLVSVCGTDRGTVNLSLAHGAVESVCSYITTRSHAQTDQRSGARLCAEDVDRSGVMYSVLSGREVCRR
ncbi:hypothetical protein AAFF_G00046700 [Aldrovandia affinis]|uniref:Uncharacterized protein n=1 Tax=Aldrovandia affinis TaxID=143900 RepID=A0AAD7S1X7_9TELE|nr:hypothetical protein AAFF_G00046700 [Aldrovandia affinis]